MNLEQIKEAVQAGYQVHWKNENYRVIQDNLGTWLIVHSNGSCVGLTWVDGKTLNGEPEEFFAR